MGEYLKPLLLHHGQKGAKVGNFA